MTRTPRITLPTYETMTAPQRAVHDKVVAGPRKSLRGPLLAALLNPDLADRWSALGELLRYRTSLAPRHSEMAILVTARACRSPFEWYAHRIEAEKADLQTPIIEAILAGGEPALHDGADRAVYRFAAELNRHRSVSDAGYAAARQALGDVGVVELAGLVGYYTMVAMTLNAHQIPLPEGVAPAFALPQDDDLK